MKDLNEIVKIEKAIAQKYGEDTIANPKHYWNQDICFIAVKKNPD